MRDEIIEEEAKTVALNFNEKNVVCKTKHFCVLLAFLLITIALLIAVSISCYLIQNKPKEKHNESQIKKFCINYALQK